MVEWWNGGMPEALSKAEGAEWWNGGMVEWWNGGMPKALSKAEGVEGRSPPPNPASRLVLAPSPVPPHSTLGAHPLFSPIGCSMPRPAG
jgi:hypothetical protein